MKNGLVSIVCYFSRWSLDETCTGIASAGTRCLRAFLSGYGLLFPFASPLPLQVVSDFFSSQVLRVGTFCFDWVG